MTPFRVGLCALLRLAYFLCILVLWGQPARAQSGQLPVGNAGSYVLSNAFTYYEDETAALSLQDILKPDLQARFKPGARGPQSTNFGGTRSAIWLRVELQKQLNAPERWLIELAYPPLDRLDLYVSNAAGGYDHQIGGDSLPFSTRVVTHRNHVKPIVLEDGRSSVVYLRIVSQGAVSAPTTLWQPAALWRNDQKTYGVFGLYFGLLTGLLLYNLLLFFSVRDTTYLVYVAFVACVGVSQAANSGLGGQFLWPDFLAWDVISINASHAASGGFALLFVRRFLSSRIQTPALDLFLKVQTGVWALIFLGALVLSYRIVSMMVTALAVTSVFTIVFTGFNSVRHKHPGAPAFALAWSAFSVGVIAQVMHNNGFLPSNVFTADSLLIGSALEMVLLSFALAGRINETRREKEAALAQVTSEQAMVQALQQSQERYVSVIEHVAEGMVVVQNERIVFVNFRATEILEATKSEILEEGVISRVHADDRAELTELMRRRVDQFAVPHRHQVRLQVPGKPLKWLEFGGNTVPWDGGQGLLIFFLDVTARHNAEMETQAALVRQRELNDLRSRFVAMTSHEFRTPLATILSAQDLLKRFNDRLPEDQKQELLGMIESGVNRMTGMLERVLLLGQADAHMLEFRPTKLNLVALCKDLVLEAKQQHSGSPCQIETEFSLVQEDGLFDAKLIRHIFGNLLSNALKYSPSGGTVRLKVFNQGPQTVFEVSDQGIGIPPGEIDHLFESFHRASNVGDIQGSGLGLAIVKQSVDLHGGTLEASSSLGKGTRFTVRLGQAG